MTTLPADSRGDSPSPDDEITALLILDDGEASVHVIVGQDRVAADFDLVRLVRHAVTMQFKDRRLKAALLKALGVEERDGDG